MKEPEQILQSLLDSLKTSVHEQEQELVSFQKAAEGYRKRAEEFAAARRAEITRTQNSIEVFETELAAMRGFRKVSAPAEPSIPASLSSGAAGSVSESERIRDGARRILRDAGRPLMQREIKAKLEEIGVEIQSADPVELIRAALRRHRSEFRHIKGEGWALVSPDD